MMHIPMSGPDSGSFYVGFKNRAILDMKSFENLFLELRHKAEIKEKGSETVKALEKGSHSIGKKFWRRPEMCYFSIGGVFA